MSFNHDSWAGAMKYSKVIAPLWFYLGHNGFCCIDITCSLLKLELEIVLF